MKFSRIDLRIDPELTLELTRIDLPHASCLSQVQIPVSVIIRCKQAKSDVVENTARNQMRSGPRSQLADGTVGVSGDPFADMYGCAHSGDTSSF